MNPDSLSTAVAQATNFMFKILNDVRKLLQALDAQMEQEGWAVHENKVNNELSSKMNGEWLMWWGYRHYSRESVDEAFKRLVVVVFNLAPPDAFGDGFATLLAAAVRYPNVTTSADVLQAWTDSTGVLRATLDHSGVRTLTQADFKSFTPGASAVAARALPLCSFADEYALRKRIVEPILKAEAALGAKP